MSKVTRRSSPKGGHGLFTTTEIPAGTLILFIPRPLVTIPDDVHLQNTCSNCLRHDPSTSSILTNYKPAKGVSACTGCKVVKYCGKECQKEDWKYVHKSECKIFAQLPRTLPASVRLTMRILLQRAEAQLLSSTTTHIDRFRRTSRWEGICVMSKGAHAYSNTSCSEEDVQKLYCAVLVNAITLVSETFDARGIALDSMAASINHDCTPNAVMLFDGRELSVRALTEIPQDAEVLISYVDHTAPRERRKAELSEKYFFHCRCERCEKPDGPMDGFACVCGGTGVLVHQVVVCARCRGEVPLTKDVEVLEQASWCAVDAGQDEVLSAIKRLHETSVWPLTRQPLPALHMSLVLNEYVPGANWEGALAHYLLVYLRVDPVFYPQRHHPVRVMHGFMLANLFLQVPGVDYGKVVWGLLCECAAQVGKSHGADGGFARVVARKRDEVRMDLEREEETRGWVGMKLEEIGLEGETKKVVGIVEGLLRDLKGNK